MSDYLKLMMDESRDIAAFVSGLTESEWDTPSLCTGWRVREVMAHMAVGHTASLGSYGIALGRAGFRTDVASDALAKAYTKDHSSAQIVDLFRTGTSRKPYGPTRFVPLRELFTDHLVHHQDIRRPLGMPRQIPDERLRAALEALPKLSGRVGSRRRAKGLRLVATDLDFSRGEGQLLEGPAEALIMAMCGRRAALADLRGPGVDTLAPRLEAVAS